MRMTILVFLLVMMRFRFRLLLMFDAYDLDTYNTY